MKKTDGQRLKKKKRPVVEEKEKEKETEAGGAAGGMGLRNKADRFFYVLFRGVMQSKCTGIGECGVLSACLYPS